LGPIDTLNDSARFHLPLHRLQGSSRFFARLAGAKRSWETFAN
jgi:hypothetical protein